MLVVVCNPEQPPETREIENELASFQTLLGGYIQKVPLHGTPLDAFDVFVNEDGRALEQPFNREFGGHFLVGPIVVSKANADGDQIALTPDEAARVLDALRRAR